MLANSDKLVVTGGTGFLGSHILRVLVEKGHQQIYALKRPGSKMGLVEDIAHKVKWIEGDILDIKSLEELCESAVGVIHSAAKVSYNPRDAERVMQVNVEGTANVVNVCLAQKVKKLIYISSVAALGRGKDGELVDETEEWIETSSTTTYGMAKHLAELEVWRGMNEGLSIGILNPSMILGPAYWGTSSTKLFSYVMRGGKFYPMGINGFVDVRDLSLLTYHFLVSDIINERVIVVSEMSSYKVLLQKIAHFLDRKPPQFEVSSTLGKILWRLLYFTSDPAITRETVAITSKVMTYDNSKSKDLFEFNYTPLEQTLKDTCEIYLKNVSQSRNYGYFKRISS
ncbi:NAD-dependent epimerase/dehydratase family protein [Portibacter marinus]|uniref:NAD-dependent epimerase/dehydratase family protein n=1 Tax=Portibacter marinus TaxID=2898660 RepID=UPI001F1C9708|nr:NAD-dependent epimerase/dehydratase family protein [Portibacter marinus]